MSQFTNLDTLLLIFLIQFVISTSRDAYKQDGCRLVSDYRDEKTDKLCKVMRCHDQKIVLCQKGRSDMSTYSADGVIRINIAPRSDEYMAEELPEVPEKSEEKDELELEPGIVRSSKILLALLDKNPLDGTLQYIDFVSSWLLNVLLEKTVETMYDKLLHYEEIFGKPEAPADGAPSTPGALPDPLMGESIKKLLQWYASE